MKAVALLCLLAALADGPITVPAHVRLKDGTIYQLREPPYLTGGRYVFTTTDGRVLSITASEVAEVRLLSPTPTPRPVPNAQDSRQLGAVAKQQRSAKGSHALVAPAPTPRPTASPTP
jgi:hypothetical protein